MWCFEGSPLIRVNKRNTIQWGSTKHYVKGPSRHNSSLIGRKNQAKFQQNDCVLRNGHRIKIAPPNSNSMVLVSFSSVEDALFNDVNNYYIFACRVLKIRRSTFLGHPVYGTALHEDVTAA